MTDMYKNRMSVAATLSTINPDSDLAHALVWLIEKMDKTIYEQKKRMLQNAQTN